MRRDFQSREELAEYLREQFPSCANPEHVSEIRGGHLRARECLQGVKLADYAKTRNRLDGDVTYLSPYIRHGVLNLAEVRDFALERNAPTKFLQELAWRDFFQRIYTDIGDGIWKDIEPYKTGYQAHDYAKELPEDIACGRTGTVMDVFISNLLEDGYVHNHARMYLAAYIVHWRRVRWQAGAKWFLSHLLDGDPASNNLSWQWVASTFSHKPYFFNADNLRRYAGPVYPELLETTLEPFEGSYPEIEARLFPRKRRP